MSIIGVIHLAALPGAPRNTQSISEIIDAAIKDAAVLAAAGFDAIIVENYGDAPFFADTVPPATVAAMTRVATELRVATDMDLGINVLRNDAIAALAIAAATGAEFIRVNVLSGSMYTDQGLITGRAAELGRLRASLCPEVVICADVMVKHAVPPPGLTLAAAAADLIERSGADAVIVTGSGTGRPTSLDDVRTVAKLAGDMPVMVGSGETTQTIAKTLEVADAVIVGSATKVDGVTTNPVDPERAEALVRAAKKEQ